MFNLDTVHPSWQLIVTDALTKVNSHYIQELSKNTDWLPGSQQIFNAFTLPLSETKYILFGESPYPREKSAIGYAFWDGAVGDIWSDTGLSKQVNRATSLRNIIKMLLVSENLLDVENTSQEAIMHVNKSQLIQSLDDLFNNLLKNGFLLLNASLALGAEYSVRQHAKMWLPFVECLLNHLQEQKADIQLILLGNIAKIIQKMPITEKFSQIIGEHPYNISFISNKQMLNFFYTFHLLKK